MGSDVTVPSEASAQKPEDVIALEARHRIEDHLGRRARYNPTASLKAITTQLAQEYEDRFLVELIQNAYDAHPDGTEDGRVHVRLDESTSPPILYVANRGQPFETENFDALTNVALSSKPPGEGIGNKGVGFRSVLQVCEFPEIYSVNPENPTSAGFTGYCFGFATDGDIREMVSRHEDFETIVRDFSRYLLPVPAKPDDPYLDRLREQHMVTVVRLPLASPAAVELARTQVQRLVQPYPPIALFLQRLSSITVDHIDADGQLSVSRVDRQVQDIPVDGPGPALQWVETSGCRFLTATHRLPADEVRAVVHHAIENGELDTSWRNWTSDVEVSVAVEPRGENDDARVMFTYLPMRAPSPVHAHLHAPFHTKMARLDLTEQSIFNAFLLRIASQLAAETISVLVSGRVDLDLQTRQAATVDLLCWDRNHISTFINALTDAGCGISGAGLAPIHSVDGNERWARLQDARTWLINDAQILSVDRLALHAPILEPGLGAGRINRLSQVLQGSLIGDLRPSDDEVAGWVEQVATTMQKSSVNSWNRFLADVARAFTDRGRSPSALQGRAILLDDQKKVRRAGPWRGVSSVKDHPTVFVPPLLGRGRAAADEVDLSQVPKSLHRAFSFLHRDIKVRGAKSERTPVGELLRNADLVEQFELVAVLTHLQRLLAGRVSDRTYSQALRWVFAQEAASRSVVVDLPRIGLRVPTGGGWIAASQAVFSPGWGTPRSATLATLLSQAREASPTLVALRESTIRPPEDWPFKIRDIPAFRGFLGRCGVRDGLFPVQLRSSTAIRMNGVSFEPSTIARRFGLEPDPVWVEHVNEAKARYLEGPNTPYTGDSVLWVLPGQDAYGDLSDRAKDRFAAALLEAAQHWPEATLSYGWRRRSPRHAARPDPQTWPSPARTFLERGSWFPMSDAGRRDDHYFVRPRDGWTFDESASDTAPRFVRLAPKEHRRRLVATPALADRLVRAGLKVWNSPGSARDRLVELGQLLRNKSMASGDALSVRRAAIQAWSDLAQQQVRLPADLGVIVTRGDALAVVAKSVEQPPTLYVLDEPPGLVARVLEASEMSMLVADPRDGTTAAGLLAAVPGLSVRPTSAVNAEVYLDGDRVAPGAGTGTRLLDIFGPWLAQVLLAVLDLRSTLFERITDRVLHDAEARLRAMRLILGTKIELSVDGEPLPMEGHLGDAIHLDDPDHPLLVVRSSGLDFPSWHALDVLADDIAALLKQPRAASEFRAAALALDRSVGEWRQPTPAELAGVLRCSADAVRDLLRDLRTSTEHIRHRLAPFVAVLAGTDGVDRFGDADVADADALRALLEDIVGHDEALRLLEAASVADSVDGIRRQLGTDLGGLNTALASLGRAPLHFVDEHRAAVDAYLSENRIELLAALRARFTTTFHGHGDLRSYAAARDFSTLEPDSDWLHDCERPDDSQLRDLAAAWLNNHGDEPAHPIELPSIDDVRRANGELLDRELQKMARVVHAWAAKNGREAATHWTDPEKLREALTESGCLDFAAFEHRALIAWLGTLSLWPTGMPQTTDLAVLGITATDLDRGTSARTRADMERRRRRTSLPFAGRTYDTSTDELRELVTAVDTSIDEAFLRARPTPAKLQAIPARQGPGGGGGGGPTSPQRHRGPDPTNEQTSALGLIGELLAYRWLQNVYPQDATPDAWVSENRAFILGGHPGDDTLGYDFRIARRSGSLLFEVKATRTDECVFEISDRELGVAKGARKGQYRIIHIRSVLSPSERELIVLPNPLEAESSRLFEQINRGLQLRFAPGQQ